MFAGSLGRLTFGLFLLEALAAVQILVVTTVLPAIVADLGGLRFYGWAFSASGLATVITIPLPLGGLGPNRWHGLIVRFRAAGEGQTEPGALVAAGAFGANCALVRFHQRFTDRQPETEPSQCRSRSLLKCVEYLWQSFGLNPQPTICDLDMELPVGIVASGNGDLPAVRREFHRVVDQIPEDLLQPGRIGAEMNFLRSQIQTQGQMLPFDLRLIDLERVLEQTVGINHFEVELHLTFANTR